MLVGASGVLLSHDGGETWMDPMPDSDMFSVSFGAFHTAVLDENTFCRILDHGEKFLQWHCVSDIISYVVRNLTLFSIVYRNTRNTPNAGDPENTETVLIFVACDITM